MAKSSTTGASLPIDPTANVLETFRQEAKRQDDLRAAEALRQDQLRIKTEECAHEIQALHNSYQSQLAMAESRMRDAIGREEKARIDANFSKQESDAAILELRTSSQATTLAETVNATAKAFADQTSLLRDAIEKRLSVVEQNQYQGAGRSLGEGENRTRATASQNQLIALAAVLASAFSGLVVYFVTHLK